jgi:formylglycine-generating enzyme required for sulfatase activity/tRNA A-37 threonylcarbamoyl transferase component Bud32
MTPPDPLCLILSPEQAQEAERLAADAGPAVAVAELVRRGWLTSFQAEELLEGRGGALVIDKYVLLDRLGEGGMGEVFRARHKVMKREVALKRILTKRLGSQQAVDRFLREVEAAALLSHPHVVQVFDAGESGGAHYLAMELLAGPNLADHLAKVGPLPAAEAVEYVRQACLGMHHAHEKGLIHRDLKPHNLMLDGQKRVKVLDLGLALMREAATLTKAGGYFGTVDYMAPEQVEDSHEVDCRADVYSLGCTLYHLLSGRTPFHDAHPAARPAMHLSDSEPPVLESLRPGIPPRLADVVRKMMAKKREDRFQSASEAATALAALLQPRPDAASPGRSRSVPPPPPPALPKTKDLEEPAVPPRAERRRTHDAATVGPEGEGLPRRWRAAVVLAGIACGLAVLLGLAVAAVALMPPGDRDRGKAADKDRDEKPPVRTFTNSIGMKFVLVGKGKFMMGSPKEEKYRSTDEEQHEVEITKDFFIGVTEVTQKQYRDVMGYNPCYFSHDGKESGTGKYEIGKPGGGADKVKGMDTDDFPVENVSWQDARDFLKKLSALAAEKKFGVEYRLPTEAEWEYSCRGGPVFKDSPAKSQLPFHFQKPTDSLGDGQANFDARVRYGDGKKGDESKRTNPVGKNGEASVLGLYDVYGNVWEWCSDWYAADYYGKSPKTDPQGPADGSVRVLRGGGWDNYGRSCRAACRDKYGPSYRSRNLGIRVVAVPHQ